MSTSVWTGGGGTDHDYSDGANWQSGIAPQAGDDLVFPDLSSPQTVKIDGSAAVSVGRLDISGNYSFSGQTIDESNDLDAHAGATVVLSNGITAEANIIFTVDTNASLNLSALNTGGAFTETRNGAGTMILGGGNVALQLSSGNTEIDGSTLGAVTVNGGTLTGSGSTHFLTVSGGTFAAVTGAVPSTFEVNDSVTLSSGTFSATLGPSANSILQTSGPISVSSATSLAVSFSSGFMPSFGSVYTIVSNQGGQAVSGTFQNLAEGNFTTVGGTAFQISYVGGSSHHDITLTDMGAIPTIALSASSVQPTPGTPITLTATLNGGAGAVNGDVTFFDGNTSIGSATLVDGVATLSGVSFTAGSHSIIASFPGNTVYHTAITVPTLITTISHGPVISVGTSAVLDTAKAATLNVTATDVTDTLIDGLTYTWSIVKMPSGAKTPTFAVNGTHAASTTTALFSKDGTYHFRVIVNNDVGNVATSDVDYVVKQKARGLRITPHGATVSKGGTLQFTTTALDQFSHPMRVSTTPTYTLANSSTATGSINASSGLFLAGKKTGVATIDVLLDGLTGTTAANVS